MKLFPLLLLLILGCTPDGGHQGVDFSKTVSVQQPFPSAANGDSLRVAVASMISPKETFVYYQELLGYLGKKADVGIELIQRKTYGEINELFAKGQLDLAFICSGPYVNGKDRYAFQALATPVVRGHPFYQSYLIVHHAAAFQGMEDLRNRTFAFTDPESNTGSLVPAFWLSQIGETPKTFFKEIIYTYSHDNSILAVARRLVEGAAVDGHKWEYYRKQTLSYAAQTRVIKKSDPFGSPPLVVSLFLPEALSEKLRKIVLSMHTGPDGRHILNKLMIDRFVPTQDKWYEPIRHMSLKTRQVEKIRDATPKS